MNLIENIKSAMEKMTGKPVIHPSKEEHKEPKKDLHPDLDKGHDGKSDKFLDDVDLKEGYDHTDKVDEMSTENSIGHTKKFSTKTQGSIHRLIDSPEVDLTLETRHELMMKHDPKSTIHSLLGGQVHGLDQYEEQQYNDTINATESSIHKEIEDKDQPQETVPDRVLTHIKSYQPGINTADAHYHTEDIKGQLKKKYAYAINSTTKPYESGHPSTFSEEQVKSFKENKLRPIQGNVLADENNRYVQIKGDGSKHHIHPLAPIMTKNPDDGSYSLDDINSPNYAGSDHPFAQDKVKNDDVHEHFKENIIPARIKNAEKIVDYTGESSHYINKGLITGDITYEHEKHANEISDSIRHNEVRSPRDFHVFTGISKRTDIKKIVDAKKNASSSHVPIHFPAFTSTSLDYGTAHGFANVKLSPETGAVNDILKIHVPKEHKAGLYVDHFSASSGEKEYMLDKDHVIHVNHQEPTYHGKSGAWTRIWDAHVKPSGDVE